MWGQTLPEKNKTGSEGMEQRGSLVQLPLVITDLRGRWAPGSLLKRKGKGVKVVLMAIAGLWQAC